MIDALIYTVVTLSWIWLYAATVAHITRPFGNLATVFRVTAQIHVWLWPIAGPGLLLDMTQASMQHHTFAAGLDLFILWTWWTVRNWPDDHFRRRRKKIADAVKVLGRRLVVQAAPT